MGRARGVVDGRAGVMRFWVPSRRPQLQRAEEAGRGAAGRGEQWATAGDATWTVSGQGYGAHERRIAAAA